MAVYQNTGRRDSKASSIHRGSVMGVTLPTVHGLFIACEYFSDKLAVI